tara:strand:- start:184 stop:561 length:378 start_codon:yes stop_codon:yes gene_type:complete
MLPTKEEFLELYNRKFGKSAKIQDVQIDSFTSNNGVTHHDADYSTSMDAYSIVPQLDSNGVYRFDRDFFGLINTNAGTGMFEMRMYGKPSTAGFGEYIIPMFFNEYLRTSGSVSYSFYGYSVTRY